MIRAGGLIGMLMSLGLGVTVLIRDVGINVLNGWTIVLGLTAGLLAVAAPRRPMFVVAAIVITVLGMLPALVGGLGLIYALPIGMLLAGLPRPSASTETPDGPAPSSGRVGS